MKYIDADKLKAEIERRREANKRQYHSSAGGMSWQRMCGEEDCLVELLAFLDTLPEQPKLKPMNISSAGGALGTIPPKFKLDVKPEQPVEGLEEERIRRELIGFLQDLNEDRLPYVDFTSWISWLEGNSSHWKPYAQQIAALEMAIEERDEGDPIVKYLKTLLDDLKKL